MADSCCGLGMGLVSPQGDSINHEKTRWRIKRQGSLSIILVVTVLLLSVYLPQEARAAAAFTVSPNPATVGSLITINGTGFTSGTVYYGQITFANGLTSTLYFCEGTGGGITPNPNPVSGSCTATVTGLSLAINLWWGGVRTATVNVCAVKGQTLTGTTPCPNGGANPVVATGTFNILPSVSLYPTSGPVGSSVTGGALDTQTGDYYIGSGFDTGSGFGMITWDGNPLGTTNCNNVDHYGNITAGGNHALPPSGCYFVVSRATYGTHTVTVTDGSRNTGTATFFVTPTLSLSQYAGTVGTAVTATGTGFSGGASYQLFWTTGSGSRIVGASGTTDALGSFSTTFTVPYDVAGPHALEAIDSNGVYSQVTFVVNPLITVSPLAGIVGTAFTGTGTGFAGASTVTITWDFGLPAQTVYPTVTSKATGSFSFGPFVTPPSPYGTNTIRATDGSGNTYSVSFSISASLKTTPYSGGPSTTVSNTTAFGFHAGSAMTLFWDLGLPDQTTIYGAGGVAGTSPTSNAVGSTYFAPWSLTLLPAMATTRGVHTLEAQDAQGIIATSTFYIGANIVLNPTFGYANSSFMVSGYDFAVGQPSGTTVSVQILWSGLITPLTSFSFVTSASNLYGNFTAMVHAPFDPMGVYMVKATALVSASMVNAFANFTLFPSVNETLAAPPPIGGGGPLAGPTGKLDYLTFQGFPAATYVQVYYDGAGTNLRAVTNARGSVMIPFTIPLSPAKPHGIYGEDAATDTSYAVYFNVTPVIIPSTAATYVGNTVSVTATGFAAAATVTLTWDGAPLAGTNAGTDAAGSATLSFQVPSPAGVHQLGAYDSSLDVAPAVPFTVWSPGVPTLASPLNGGYVNVSTNPGLTLSWNPVPNGNVTYTAELSTNGTFGSGTRTFPRLLSTTLAVGPLADGTYYWCVEAVTNSGATAGWSAAWSFLVDTIPPTSNVHRLPATENTLAFPLYWSANDSGSGVKGVYLYWTNTSGKVWELVTPALLPGSTGSYTFSAPGAGTYEFSSVAVDRAGNTGAFPGAQATTIVDPVVPTTTIALSGPLGAKGWFTGPVTVTVSASGGPSGVKSIWVNPGSGWVAYTAPFTLSANGVYNVSAYALSGTGVTGPTVTQPVRVDATVPTTSSNALSSWYTSSPVAITLTAVGGPSGIVATYWSVDGLSWKAGTSVLISGDGVHTLSFYSVSGAGLAETAHEQTVRIDTVPPVTRATLAGNLTSSGWYGSAVTLSLSVQDNSSGVAGTWYSTTAQGGPWTHYSTPLVFAKTGSYAVWFYSTDVAGNTEAVRQISFQIDLAFTSITLGIAPGATIAGSPTHPFPITVTDPAGVSAIYVSVDDGPPLLIWSTSGGTTQTSVNVNYAIPTGSMTNGEHLVTVTAFNELGQSTSTSETVNVNNASISGVVSLVGVVIFLVLGLLAMLLLRRNWRGNKRHPASLHEASSPAPSPESTGTEVATHGPPPPARPAPATESEWKESEEDEPPPEDARGQTVREGS